MLKYLAIRYVRLSVRYWGGVLLGQPGPRLRIPGIIGTTGALRRRISLCFETCCCVISAQDCSFGIALEQVEGNLGEVRGTQ